MIVDIIWMYIVIYHKYSLIYSDHIVKWKVLTYTVTKRLYGRVHYLFDYNFKTYSSNFYFYFFNIMGCVEWLLKVDIILRIDKGNLHEICQVLIEIW